VTRRQSRGDYRGGSTTIDRRSGGWHAIDAETRAKNSKWTDDDIERAKAEKERWRRVYKAAGAVLENPTGRLSQVQRARLEEIASYAMSQARRLLLMLSDAGHGPASRVAVKPRMDPKEGS